MARIFVFVFLINFSSHSLYPSFLEVHDTNLKLVTSFLQKLLGTLENKIRVEESSETQCCIMEADLVGLDLIRKNHARYLQTLAKDIQVPVVDHIRGCLLNEIISFRVEQELCYVSIKNYDTRKQLIFPIKIQLFKITERAFPAFGKTEEESLKIAVAIIDTVRANNMQGEVEIIQKKENEMDVDPFIGKLMFEVTRERTSGVNSPLTIQFTKNELDTHHIILTRVAKNTKGVLYCLCSKRGHFDDCFFTLNFTNSVDHQTLQLIYPTIQSLVRKDLPHLHTLFSALFFKRFTIHGNREPKVKSVAIIVPYGYLGERNWSAAIVETLVALEISNLLILQENCVVPNSELRNEEKKMFSYILEQLEDLYQIDVSLSLSHILCKILKNVRVSLIALTLSDAELMQEIDKHPQIRNQLLVYDGYLHAKPHHGIIGTLIATKKISQNLVHTFYPSNLPSKLSAKSFRKLIYCGQNWDKKRGSKKFADLFKELENKCLIDVYGPSWAWPYLSSSYKGLIPFENDGMAKALADYGIVLCLHSDSHIQEGIPTARFFEVVSVGALPICDEHPFFLEHFKDAALFIDTSGTAESIFNQIRDHLIWVSANSDEVRLKASRGKEIFIEKFSLDKSLSMILTHCKMT